MNWQQIVGLALVVAIPTAVFGLVIYAIEFEFDRVFTMGLSRKPHGMSQKRWDAIQAARACNRGHR